MWTGQFADDASVAVALATEADMSAQVIKFIPQFVRQRLDLCSKILKTYVCLIDSLSLLPTSLEILAVV
jgi:hypothetical protein